MASSVIDSRNPASLGGLFPNNSVTINGTVTYTVQQFESRAAGAPVDSRAAGAPVASAVSYPQNSRA